MSLSTKCRFKLQYFKLPFFGLARMCELPNKPKYSDKPTSTYTLMPLCIVVHSHRKCTNRQIYISSHNPPCACIQRVNYTCNERQGCTITTVKHMQTTYISVHMGGLLCWALEPSCNRYSQKQHYKCYNHTCFCHNLQCLLGTQLTER